MRDVHELNQETEEERLGLLIGSTLGPPVREGERPDCTLDRAFSDSPSLSDQLINPIQSGRRTFSDVSSGALGIKFTLKYGKQIYWRKFVLTYLYISSKETNKI